MELPNRDDIDKKILAILLENGRASYSDIGAQLGLSRVAVKMRIKGMERDGVITGYKVILANTQDLDMITFILNLETTAEDFEHVRDVFAALPQIHYLVQTTGECHLTGIGSIRDLNALRRLVNGTVKDLQGVRKISAHMVLDHVKGGFSYSELGACI